MSADGADWIHDVVREKAPGALTCLDAFHVVKWAGERLDELRRRLASGLRAAGKGDQAAAFTCGCLCPDDNECRRSREEQKSPDRAAAER